MRATPVAVTSDAQIASTLESAFVFFTSHIKLHREHLHEDDLLGRLVQVEILALDENPEFVKGLAGHALLRLPGMMKKPGRGP